MSALRLPNPGFWRPLIIKLYKTSYSLDPYADRLYSHGYEVINTNTYSSTLKSARESRPALIVVHDDPDNGIDALDWLAMQHFDAASALSMTPLIVLADTARLPILGGERQADRVIILQNRADTLNQLTRTVKRTLRVWGLDQPPE